MLLAVIDEKKKNNSSSEFKLELITTYNLKFVGKVLWKILLVRIMKIFVIKKSCRQQDSLLKKRIPKIHLLTDPPKNIS